MMLVIFLAMQSISLGKSAISWLSQFLMQSKKWLSVLLTALVLIWLIVRGINKTKFLAGYWGIFNDEIAVITTEGSERERNVPEAITVVAPNKSIWNVLELLGVPLVLAGLGFWFQKVQQEQTADETREEVLQLYFDRISALLIDKNLMAIASKKATKEYAVSEWQAELLEVSINVVQARTSSILRRFERDSERISSVLQFLSEADVINRLKIDLSGANLISTKLRAADLSGANLNGVYLSGANLRGVNLRRANLSNVNLRGANLSAANLSGTNLNGADLCGATLIEVNLRGANLREANLREANLREADLREVNLSEANLSGAYLRGAYTQKANLSKANLRGADLLGVNLRRAILRGADLSKANLSKAYLHGANLREVILHEVDLSGANLSEAYLCEVNLSEADLSGADVKSARFVRVTGLSELAKRDLKTSGAIFEDVREIAK